MALRLRRWFVLLLGAIGALWLSALYTRTALATEVIVGSPLSPSDARIVFSGRVVRTWVSPAEEGGAVTNVLFREVRFAKGGGGQDSVVVTVWGGVLGPERYEIAGRSPERFAAGKRYVVLLSNQTSLTGGAVIPHVRDFLVLERVGPHEENYVEMGPGDLSQMGMESGLLTEDEFLARCAPFLREYGPAEH